MPIVHFVSRGSLERHGVRPPRSWAPQLAGLHRDCRRPPSSFSSDDRSGLGEVRRRDNARAMAADDLEPKTREVQMEKTPVASTAAAESHRYPCKEIARASAELLRSVGNNESPPIPPRDAEETRTASKESTATSESGESETASAQPVDTNNAQSDCEPSTDQARCNDDTSAPTEKRSACYLRRDELTDGEKNPQGIRNSCTIEIVNTTIATDLTEKFPTAIADKMDTNLKANGASDETSIGDERFEDAGVDEIDLHLQQAKEAAIRAISGPDTVEKSLDSIRNDAITEVVKKRKVLHVPGTATIEKRRNVSTLLAYRKGLLAYMRECRIGAAEERVRVAELKIPGNEIDSHSEIFRGLACGEERECTIQGAVSTEQVVVNVDRGGGLTHRIPGVYALPSGKYKIEIGYKGKRLVISSLTQEQAELANRVARRKLEATRGLKMSVDEIDLHRQQAKEAAIRAISEPGTVEKSLDYLRKL